jgi:diguanylate cyclase (GGDEF)-like protein
LAEGAIVNESARSGLPTVQARDDVVEFSDHPFLATGLMRRVLPFALVSVFALVSLAFTPRDTSVAYAALASGFLCIVAAGFLLPWARLPTWTTVLVPMVDVVFVLMLILAAGPLGSGIGPVALIPIVWTALYHRRWESLVVVGMVIVNEVILSFVPVHVGDAVFIRRVVVWCALGLLISTATHELRRRLHCSMEEREFHLQRTEALARASEELTTLRDPDAVVLAATRLAVECIPIDGKVNRRVQYNKISDGIISVVAQYDEAGTSISGPIPLLEQPNMIEVLREGVPIYRSLSTEAAGPIVSAMIEQLGVTSSAYIPVFHDGIVDGVLSIPMRGGVAAPDLLDACRTFGHIIELALNNAYANVELEAQATTDDLTGMPNRRAFERLLQNRPGRGPFAIMVIDIDELKAVNDSLGHESGDELLMRSANGMKRALRQGDVVARIGGDEFAVFLFDADGEAAKAVASRILAVVGEPTLGPSTPSLSIGISCGNEGSDPKVVLRLADRAMYQAKRSGGNRSFLNEEEVQPSPTARH